MLSTHLLAALPVSTAALAAETTGGGRYLVSWGQVYNARFASIVMELNSMPSVCIARNSSKALFHSPLCSQALIRLAYTYLVRDTADGDGSALKGGEDNSSCTEERSSTVEPMLELLNATYFAVLSLAITHFGAGIIVALHIPHMKFSKRLYTEIGTGLCCMIRTKLQCNWW